MSKIIFHETTTLSTKNLVVNHKPFEDVLHIFDLEKKILKRTILLPDVAYRARLCLRTDTIVFVCGDRDYHIFPTVEVWSLSTTKQRKKIEFGYLCVFDIFLSELGNFLLCCVEDDMFLYLINMHTFKIEPLAMSSITCANNIAISADEQFCAAATEENAFVWSIQGQLLQKILCNDFFTNFVHFVRITDSSHVSVWNFVSDGAMMKLPNQNDISCQVLVSSGWTDVTNDGKYFVNLSYDDTIRVFEFATMNVLRKIRTTDEQLRPNIFFSSNNRKIYYVNKSEIRHYKLIDCNDCYILLFVLLHKHVAPYVVLDILNLCISKKESSTFASESAFLLKDKLDAITCLMRLNE